ncbi:hypothetical protein H632_c131p2 [Helicosporidium sp. ATCC 50920]|nr:hypothetical protein H632_c131p2 [Helicosporidium sp. ATCC 50920]|eukprot:KDD76711.1 hypothetical protein H632_c131p2 [Helicosporidium sp. ATCC 50920]
MSVLAVFLFCTREAFLLAYAVIGGGTERWLGTASFGAFIFFSDVAESYFFWVLIAIAAGFCITRSDLGPHKTVSLVIPGIFFLTSLVVDYVMFGLRGQDAFSDVYESGPICVQGEAPGDADLPCDPSAEVSPVEGLVFFVCIVANMMAFMLAWFYVFETVQKERERLQLSLDGEQAAEAQLGALPLSHAGLAPPLGAAPAAGGEQRLPTAHADLYLEAGEAPALYGTAGDEDLDAPKTVQDRLELGEKIRLLRAFFYGVSAYVVATLLVLFLPVFVPTVVDRVIFVLQNALLWLLCAVLLWAFRMRAGNSYLVLDEGTAEAATELGVLAPRSEYASDHPQHSLGGRKAGEGPTFTLDDDDDEHGVIVRTIGSHH